MASILVCSMFKDLLNVLNCAWKFMTAPVVIEACEYVSGDHRVNSELLAVEVCLKIGQSPIHQGTRNRERQTRNEPSDVTYRAI